jgi:hypothetical protein
MTHITRPVRRGRTGWAQSIAACLEALVETLALAGDGGGEPGEQDVQAAFEFGGAVVAGQDRGEAAEQGEVGDRQPVQAEPQQVVGLVGVKG